MAEDLGHRGCGETGLRRGLGSPSSGRPRSYDLRWKLNEVVHRGSSMHGLSILRSLIRVPACDDGSGLEWNEAGEVHKSSARLASVGSGGARVLADPPPPLHQVVRVRVDDIWVQGFVARHHSRNL